MKMQLIIEALNKTDRAFADLRRNLDQSGASGQQAMGRIDNAAGTARDRLTALAGAAKAVAAALAAVGAGLLARDVAQAAISYERMENALKAVTGSGAGATRELGFVRGEANRLGLSLETAAGGYTKLAASAIGTTMAGQGARDIFTAVAEASTVLGLSAADTEGAIRALSQVMSKGKLQAEELRGQLGERIPGAFQIAARAMGVTSAKLSEMLDRGEVYSDVFLPKFAAELRKTFAGALPDAVNSAQANLNRFQTALYSLKVEFAKSGFMDALVAGTQAMTKALQDQDGILSGGLRKGWAAILGLVESVWLVLEPFSPLLVWLGKLTAMIADGWGMIATVILPVVARLINNTLISINAIATIIWEVAGVVKDVIGFIGGSLGTIGGALLKAATGDVKGAFEALGKLAADAFAASFAGRKERIKTAIDIAFPKGGPEGQAQGILQELETRYSLYQRSRLSSASQGAGAAAGGVAGGAGEESEAQKRAREKAADELLKFRRDLEDRATRLLEDAGERELALLRLRHAREIEEAKKHGHDLAALLGLQSRERQAVEDEARAAEKNQRLKSFQDANRDFEQSAKEAAEAARGHKQSLDEITMAALPQQAQAAEEVRRRYAELNAAVDELAAAGIAAGGIAKEQADQLHQALGLRLREDLDALKDKAKSMAEEMTDAFKGWASNMSRELTDVLWGAEFSFGKIAESFGKMLTQMLLQKSIIEPLFATGTGGAGGPAGFLGFLGKLFGGGRASGGPVAPGMVYRVSEVEPEFLNVGGRQYVMMGSSPGQVTPLSRIGAAGGQGGNVISMVVNLIEAPGAANTGQVNRRQEGGANILDIYVEKIKGAIAADITVGAGPVPAALAGTYGLNRLPGMS